MRFACEILANNSMQRMALRAAEPNRSASRMDQHTHVVKIPRSDVVAIFVRRSVVRSYASHYQGNSPMLTSCKLSGKGWRGCCRGKRPDSSPKSMPEVVAVLPSDPKKMLRPEFLLAVAEGKETWLTRAMVENDVFDWTPKAPIRFYYGSGDKDSPAADTRFTVKYMLKRGGHVMSVDLGDKDYNAVAFAAVSQVRGWFDQFAASGPRGT